MAPNRKIAAGLLALAAPLAGCTSDPALIAKHNPTLYSVHQPVVQRRDYVIDLATGGGGLASGEAARLHAWFDAVGLRYGDAVSVDEGGAFVNNAAREDVADVTAAYGLLLNEGTVVTAGPVQPGYVRVAVSRASASVDSCPDWSYSQLPGAPVSTDSNYGCAYNKNVAAMVADPRDLVLGQAADGSGDASSASKPIKAYRDRQGTGASGEVKAIPVGGN